MAGKRQAAWLGLPGRWSVGGGQEGR